MHRSQSGWVLSLLVAALTAMTLSGCGAAATKSSTSSPAVVVDAPVQVAHTALGDVEYRVTGSGPALVLIMGYAGTMETWDPHFVDMLARHFRVYLFDNAGTGRTASLASPLTIDAMANQTSALITELHLGSPDVLGWSMGGMIAQALAVLHPAQVHRLILAATFPGNGNAVQPSQSDIAALTSGNVAATQAVLFPADQTLADDAFSGSLDAYPASSPASASAISGQAGASLAWFDGRDVAGHDLSRIVVPTLVADGASDRLDAVANDRELSSLISHSKLVLYPDAGHAFLFQEGATFTFLVRTFLLGVPTPLSVAKIRQSYLTDYKVERSAGTRWVAKLKSLTSKSTPEDLARIDLSLGDAVGALDDELLSFGATSNLGAAVVAYVNAEERSLSDVLALGALSGSTAKTYKATSARDGLAGVTLGNALRRLLNLPAISTTTTTTTLALNNL
jgi:pimeloyl-ACP methyl ester carboxylesterase